jgi:hypothetical protein
MSKNNPNNKKASKRNAPVIIDVDYLNGSGHDGETAVGVSIERHILVDIDGEGSGELKINANEARRIGLMLIAAADKMDAISR